MGTIMCFCNRLLVTKFVNIPFKIGSLLGCLLCVEHSSENAQVQGQKMNEKAANAQRKSWLTIAFKIWICNYLRFTAISSTAIKLKFRKRPFISDVPNIQQSQVCEIIQSWTLDTEIKRFREAFFSTVFLCEWIMSYKLNFTQYRHFYHPLIDNSKTLLIDQPFHTKVRWMSCKWSCDHLLFYLFTRGCVYMYGQKIFRKMSHEGRRPKCCPESKSFLQKDTIQWGKQSNWGVGKQHKTSPQISPEATHKNKREEAWKAGKKTAGIQTRLMTAVADKTQATLTRVIWTITQGKWTKTANKTHRNAQRPVITK